MPEIRAHQPPRASAKANRERTPVEAADGVWLQDTVQNPMIISAVYVTDPLDVETMRNVWRRRITEAGGGRRYPRFTQRIVSVGGRDYWEDDQDYDLARHIFECPDREGVRTKEDLQELVASLAAQPLSGDRPLWQIQTIPEYGDGSAFIVRIHHSIGDGASLVPVLFALVDPVREEDDRENEGQVSPRVETGKAVYARTAVKVAAAAAGPYVLLKKAVRRRDANALTGSVLSGTKRVSWSAPLDLDKIKDVKNRLGATVNDVLMACVAGSVRRYDQRHGNGKLHSMRATVPVNVRAPGEPYKMGNKFAAVLLELPGHVSDPLNRVREIKRRMDRLKRSVEPLVMYGAASFMLKALPRGASRRLIDFFANKCSCVLTNVPGPQEPLSLAGRRLRHLMFWVPQRAEIGVGISILSFSGMVRVGVISDAEVVDDPGEIVEGFEDEFWTLAETVGIDT